MLKEKPYERKSLMLTLSLKVGVRIVPWRGVEQYRGAVVVSYAGESFQGNKFFAQVAMSSINSFQGLSAYAEQQSSITGFQLDSKKCPGDPSMSEANGSVGNPAEWVGLPDPACMKPRR